MMLSGEQYGGRFFALLLLTWACPIVKLKIIVYEKDKHG